MVSEFFETIKILDGKHFNLPYHQQRYESVLRAFGKNKFDNLSASISAPQKGLFRCRIVYNIDALVSIEYIPYVKREIRSLKLLYDDNIEYKFKSTSRDALDALYSKRASCDDVLIVQNGCITDTSIANIALEKDGIWYSPKTVLLEGTTRAKLLEKEKIVLKDIKVQDLKNYTRVGLLNSMIGFDIMTLNKGDFFVK